MNRRTSLQVLAALPIVAAAPEVQAASGPNFVLHTIFFACYDMPTVERLRKRLTHQFKIGKGMMYLDHPGAKAVRVAFSFEKKDGTPWTTAELWGQPEALRSGREEIICRAMDLARGQARVEGILLDPLDIGFVKIRIFFTPS